MTNLIATVPTWNIELSPFQTPPNFTKRGVPRVQELAPDVHCARQIAGAIAITSKPKILLIADLIFLHMN
jgi:hypothetical protein